VLGHDMLEIPRAKMSMTLSDDYFASIVDIALFQDQYHPGLPSNSFSCQFLANEPCDFDFIWFLTPDNSIFMHHNDFNIDKATNTMGMARKALAQNVTILMREKR
jgi:hypothetical protein